MFASGTYAGEPTPYTSDIYIDYTLDAGWSTVNNVRRGGISWTATGIDDEILAIGAKGGACKKYDSYQTNTADCWLISPAIDLKGGITYEVSIYAKTKTCDECFRITAAGSSEMADLKAGTVVIDKKDYQNRNAYEKITGTFTPETDGEVVFGIQCYSEPDMDWLLVSRFNVSDPNAQGGGDDPVVTPVDGKTLPYKFDFKDSEAFAADWKSVAGSDAVVSNSWTLGYSGYANWDFTNGKKEDNWLISPGLAVDKAGSYALDSKVYNNGKLEVLLGTDADDLTSFQLIATYENAPFPSDSDKPFRENINIETPGTYYIAYRACSEQGTYMGHRVYISGLKANVPAPAIVEDLKASPDFTDELSVDLSWTYPSLSNTGEPLTEIVKAELYRGEELIETFHYPDRKSVV